MNYWTIALFGTNTNYTIDTNSEIDLSSLSTSDPMADNNWLKIKIKGMSPEIEKVDGIKQHVGLISKNPVGQIRKFSIELMPYAFPTEMAELEKLYTLLDKLNIFLFKGDYDFPSDGWSIHNDAKAIGIALVQKTNHSYDDGTKEITLTGQKVNPKPRT